MTSPEHPKLTLDFDADCRATREVLTRVGDKWSVLIVATLSHAPHRFNALKRTIDGISQRMLTTALRGLERDGLVSREVFPTKPPQVEYRLTELGQTLIEPVIALATWANAHRADVYRARENYDAQVSGPGGRASLSATD